MSAVDFSQVTAVVTTRGSADHLERLLLSMRKFVPRMRVMASVDQAMTTRADIECVAKPKTGGVAAARNALLARVRTPYFLLLSDEFELNKSTQLERLLRATAEQRFDLTAGELVRCVRRMLLFTRRIPSPSHGTFVEQAGALRVEVKEGPSIDGCCDCDLVQPFYMARTDKIRSMGGWEGRLQIGEREEFFVRARRYGIRVGLCADVTAWHWPIAVTPAGDASAQRSLAAARMGVHRFTDLEGLVYESPAGQAQAA